MAIPLDAAKNIFINTLDNDNQAAAYVVSAQEILDKAIRLKVQAELDVRKSIGDLWDACGGKDGQELFDSIVNEYRQ